MKVARLRQYNDGESYFLDYRDVDGKRYRVNTGIKDPKIAELWLRKYEELATLARLGVIDRIGEITSDTVAGRKRKKEDKSPTLRDFKVKYEDRSINDLELSASSIRLNNLALDSFIGAVGNRKLSELTDEDVVKWKRKLAAEGISRTTLAIYHRQLRAAWNRAVKWQWIESNPFAVIEIARERTEDRPAKSMSYDEVQLLLKTINDAGDMRFSQYVLFALYTACRRGEISRLKWEDIDRQNWTMKVYAEKTKRHLTVPINKALKSVIEKMQPKETGYVFQTLSNRGNARNKNLALVEGLV